MFSFVTVASCLLYEAISFLDAVFAICSSSNFAAAAASQEADPRPVMMTGSTGNAGSDRPKGAGGVSLDQARRGEFNEPKNEKIRPLGAEIAANDENGARMSARWRNSRTDGHGGAGGVSLDCARRDESNEPENGQIGPLGGEIQLDDAITAENGAKHEKSR